MPTLRKRKLCKNCTRFLRIIESSFRVTGHHLGAMPQAMDVPFTSPYNVKKSTFWEIHPRAVRAEIHDQSAPDRLPHEGQPAPERAQGTGEVGADEDLRPHSQGARRSSHVDPARRT